MGGRDLWTAGDRHEEGRCWGSQVRGSGEREGSEAAGRNGGVVEGGGRGRGREGGWGAGGWVEVGGGVCWGGGCERWWAGWGGVGGVLGGGVAS